eukprot:Trichotokara_eunicae@DN9120_c0_g1_i1.p2
MVSRHRLSRIALGFVLMISLVFIVFNTVGFKGRFARRLADNEIGSLVHVDTLSEGKQKMRRSTQLFQWSEVTKHQIFTSNTRNILFYFHSGGQFEVEDTAPKPR